MRRTRVTVWEYHHARNPLDLSDPFAIDDYCMYRSPLLDLSLATQDLSQDRVTASQSIQWAEESHSDKESIDHRPHCRRFRISAGTISITV